MTTKRKSSAMKFVDKVIGEPMTFGSTLENLRVSEAMTQTAFAKILGISQAHLSLIEKDLKVVTPQRAEKFAKKLGYNEVTFVELAVQGLLVRAGIKMKVKITAA